MKEMKRILSIFLCLLMVFGAMPLHAMGVENWVQQSVQIVTTVGEDAVEDTSDEVSDMAAQKYAEIAATRLQNPKN